METIRILEVLEALQEGGFRDLGFNYEHGSTALDILEIGPSCICGEFLLLMIMEIIIIIIQEFTHKNALTGK